MEIEKIKQKILKEITKTEKLILTFKEMKKPEANKDSVGRVSHMNELNNITISYASQNHAKVKLKALKKVLSQLGTDSFGVCLKCGKTIAVGRILVRPESLLCVKCAR